MVAEMADKWGAFGNDKFVPVDPGNAQGYWEYAPLVQFNRRLMVSVGSQSLLPPTDDEENKLIERASEPVWRDEALQLVAAMESGNRVWYWKDPRLGVMLPFWQKIWDNVVHVITVREPLDTALSLKKRDNVPLTAGYLLWQRYLSAILKYTEGHPRQIFLQYEQILAEPARECRRLCDFLDEHCPLNGVQPPQKRVDRMMRAVNQKLRSNSNDGAFLSLPEVTGGQRVLYKYLRSRAQSQVEPLDPGVFAIYPGWKEYLQTVVTLNRLRETLWRKEQTLPAKIQRRLTRRHEPARLPL